MGLLGGISGDRLRGDGIRRSGAKSQHLQTGGQNPPVFMRTDRQIIPANQPTPPINQLIPDPPPTKKAPQPEQPPGMGVYSVRDFLLLLGRGCYRGGEHPLPFYPHHPTMALRPITLHGQRRKPAANGVFSKADGPRLAWLPDEIHVNSCQCRGYNINSRLLAQGWV